MPPIKKCPLCGSRKNLIERTMNNFDERVKKYLACTTRNCRFDAYYLINPIQYTNYRVSVLINNAWYIAIIDIDLKRVVVRNDKMDYTIYENIIIPFELGIEGIRNKIKFLHVWC